MSAKEIERANILAQMCKYFFIFENFKIIDQISFF
jgi:hypothetical protein